MNIHRDEVEVNIYHYHSLYSILDFDWLIHLQITACKYRSTANNWCKYFIEHAHFENASSASIKKYRSFFQNVNIARFAELSESEIIDLLATDKSRYFAQSRPLILYNR